MIQNIQGKFPKVWVWDHTQDFCSSSLTSGSISPATALPVQPGKVGNAERHLPWKAQEDEIVAESFAEQTCGSWDADGVILSARPGACCAIPACTSLLPAGKRSTRGGTPEWWLVMDSRWGSLSTSFNSLVTFLTLTMCTAWGAFGTHRDSLVGTICCAQKCHCSPLDSSWFCTVSLALKTTG